MYAPEFPVVGSPILFGFIIFSSQHYRLPPDCVITEVNGTPTPDLEAFNQVVASLKDDESVRIRFRTNSSRVWLG